MMDAVMGLPRALQIGLRMGGKRAEDRIVAVVGEV